MLTVMTGPCVLEDMDTVLKIAEALECDPKELII